MEHPKTNRFQDVAEVVVWTAACDAVGHLLLIDKDGSAERHEVSSLPWLILSNSRGYLANGPIINHTKSKFQHTNFLIAKAVTVAWSQPPGFRLKIHS